MKFCLQVFAFAALGLLNGCSGGSDGNSLGSVGMDGGDREGGADGGDMDSAVGSGDVDVGEDADAQDADAQDADAQDADAGPVDPFDSADFDDEPTACSGEWVYGTLGGQAGWTAVTNDYAQPDSFLGTTQVLGDEPARGLSVVGTFAGGDGLEEAGQVFAGSRAVWFKRGYDSPGSGTPQSPNIEPAGLGSDADSTATGGDGAYRDTFRYSLRIRAHQNNDGSRLAIVTGKIDGNDNASNYLEVANDGAGGMRVRVLVQTPGGGWDGTYTDIADGLAYDTWHEIVAVMKHHPGAVVDLWQYRVDGVLSDITDGYYSVARDEFSFDYESSSRMKLRPRHANYDGSKLGFYLDNLAVSSWRADARVATKSEYCANFEGEPGG